VPGIKVADILTPGYGNPNAYFGRMLRKEEKASATYLDKILEQKPSVFTCWLGNNDVLGFATAGGYADLGKVTPAATFSSNFQRLLQGLQDLPTKPRGAVANIPDITSIPFFTTVTPTVKEKMAFSGDFYLYEFKFDSSFQDVVIPTFLATDSLLLKPSKINRWSASHLASLNGVTGNFEGDVFLTLTFSPYASLVGKPSGKAWKDIIHRLVNTFVLPAPFDQIPKDTLEKIAWLKSGLDTLQPFGTSLYNPVPDVFVLNPHESGRARSAVETYNQIIKAQADARGLAHVDGNGFMKAITKGAYFDAISTNAAFLSGGAFSLDGVHLTPRGNALAANEFIKALNAKYGSKIPILNPGQFKGVILP
jgi:lysophospholipase L1-like esterase